MYSGENSGSISNRNVCKDTLHISPHIASHKSAVSSQSNGQSGVGTSQKQDEICSRLAPIQSFASHVPGYRVGIPTSTVFSEPFQHSIRSQSAHLQVPTIFTIPPSKSVPQDLSAHTTKLTSQEVENGNSSKPLPHIHSVTGQGLENIAGPLIVPVSDRCPAYYRLADGTTISISSQHSAMLVSSQNDDSSPGQQSHIDSVRPNQHTASESIHNTPISSSMSLGSFTGTVNAHHQHAGVGGLPDNHLYIVPHDIPGGSFMSEPEAIIPDREIIRSTQIEGIKEEIGEHKDLVHQALQAAAVQNNNKNTSAQEPIEYNYGADAMAELLLVNINMNQNNGHASKTSGTGVEGSDVNESSPAGPVVLLEPASLDDAGNILPPIIVSSRRRRSRLSEEAQALRREKIANRMREKRANETEEQKEKRRMREAERMRKKRAQEDEISKERRRREAAERARLRRARLSNEERELERKKAAARMRLRRQNENEEQKRLRRIKAAERMRKRRSTETPEERAVRKHNIAMRMKVKRQRKEDKDEKVDMETNSSLDSSVLTSEDDKKMLEGELNRDDPLMLETNGQFTTNCHIGVSSSVTSVPTNLTLMHSDAPQSASNSATPPPRSIYPAIEVPETHISRPQPLSLQMRSMSPSDFQRSEGSNERSSLLHKSLTSQNSPSTSVQEAQSQVHSKSSESSSVLTKTSTTSLSSHHHHLPHLLHHLSPHQEQHHHSHYLPHQSQHSHQQNQPLQLRHQ